MALGYICQFISELKLLHHPVKRGMGGGSIGQAAFYELVRSKFI